MTDQQLKEFGVEIRQKTMDCVHSIGSGHVGGALSMADLLAVLYGEEMKIDPKRPDWEERDLFVCSKGHAGPTVYAALALKGYFPMEMLYTLNQNGTLLPSHCDRTKTPGVDATAGSLGQGLSIAAGAALGFKFSGTERRVYVVTGDGEQQEGQIWEAAQFAAQYKLDNLIHFVDANKMQIDGKVEQVNASLDLVEKYASFGWYAQRADGHDIHQLREAIDRAKAHTGSPNVIVIDTIKGSGIPFIEAMEYNHHIPVNDEAYAKATEALNAMMERVKKGEQ